MIHSDGTFANIFINDKAYSYVYYPNQLFDELKKQSYDLSSFDLEKLKKPVSYVRIMKEHLYTDRILKKFAEMNQPLSNEFDTYTFENVDFINDEVKSSTFLDIMKVQNNNNLLIDYNPSLTYTLSNIDFTKELINLYTFSLYMYGTNSFYFPSFSGLQCKERDTLNHINSLCLEIMKEEVDKE